MINHSQTATGFVQHLGGGGGGWVYTIDPPSPVETQTGPVFETHSGLVLDVVDIIFVLWYIRIVLVRNRFCRGCHLIVYGYNYNYNNIRFRAGFMRTSWSERDTI